MRVSAYFVFPLKPINFRMISIAFHHFSIGFPYDFVISAMDCSCFPGTFSGMAERLWNSSVRPLTCAGFFSQGAVK